MFKVIVEKHGVNGQLRQYEELRERMVREDPLIAEVFELKEGDGLSVKEIADRLGLTTRQVYY